MARGRTTAPDDHRQLIGRIHHFIYERFVVVLGIAVCVGWCANTVRRYTYCPDGPMSSACMHGNHVALKVILAVVYVKTMLAWEYAVHTRLNQACACNTHCVGEHLLRKDRKRLHELEHMHSSLAHASLATYVYGIATYRITCHTPQNNLPNANSSAAGSTLHHA